MTEEKRSSRKGKPLGKRLRLGAFYVALRQSERRILRGALADFEGSVAKAAEALGISKTFLRQRAIYLGGVFDGHPVREPPGKLALARYEARADGVPIPKATWKLQRFGKELQRKVSDDVSSSDGDGPLQRVRETSEGETRRGDARSGDGEKDRRGENRGE